MPMIRLVNVDLRSPSTPRRRTAPPGPCRLDCVFRPELLVQALATCVLIGPDDVNCKKTCPIALVALCNVSFILVRCPRSSLADWRRKTDLSTMNKFSWLFHWCTSLICQFVSGCLDGDNDEIPWGSFNAVTSITHIDSDWMRIPVGIFCF